MELQQLKALAIFVVVVQHNGFAAAARHLGMSRSAVSEQIARLEQTYQCRLLQYGGHSVSLTEKGQQLYQQVSQLPQLASSAHSLLTEEQLRGTVSISITSDLATEWFIPQMQEFEQRYPMIEFDLIVTDQWLDLLSEGIDMAIRRGPLTDTDLVVRPLFTETPICYASRSYIQQWGRPNRPEDLNEHRLICVPQMLEDGMLELRNQHQHRQVQLLNVHQTNASEVARSMVMAGLGIGWDLPLMLDKALAKGEIEQILNSWHSRQLTTAVYHPAQRQMSERCRLLVEWLLDVQSSPTEMSFR